MATKSSPLIMAGGTLDRTSLAETLRHAYRDRVTARLLVSHQQEERTFQFDRGEIVAAASNREAQLVGELLRTFGLADENLLVSAFERALVEPGHGLGRALWESGAVPEYVADAAVRALAERILYDTFRWKSGVFSVTPLDEPPAVPVRFDRTTGSLMLEALRRLPSGRSVTGFSSVEPRSRPVHHPDLLMRYQVISLSPEEADVLGRVDGVRTSEDVTRDAGIVARLAAVGLIQFLPAHKTAEMPPAGGLDSLNVEIAGAPPPTRLAEQLEEQARTVENTYRRLDWSTLYGFLGVEPTAADEEVQRAVLDRARLFHPDHHLRPQLRDSRDALEALFARVRQAERAFRTREARAGYDASLASGVHESIDLPRAAPTQTLQKQIAKANYSRAKVLYDQEDYYPAYEMVRQSVEFDPGEKDYWILLSRIQRKNPKWVRQSTETLRRALQNIQANVELLWELSEACKAERNDPERIKALREILKLDTKNRRAQAALNELGADRG